ncbi:MAG TPA: hypothetical protein VHB79_38855 [Polyangiaceae bacterium]|nr:hypothetical protein [Polyangiaceae bacterium]
MGIDKDTPITREQIVDALESSGYPFEVALYQQFAAAGMDPTLGQRFRVRDPERGGDGLVSREIDLVARVRETTAVVDHVMSAGITPLVEAKKLQEPLRLVGILIPPPERNQLVAWRAKFHGCPSFGILPKDGSHAPLFLNSPGIGDSLAPFLDAPFCAHWAVVRRKDKGPNYPPFASGDTGDENVRIHDGLQTLVAATTWLEREASEHLQSVGVAVSPVPALDSFMPTLAVHTPTLHLYDPVTRTLSDVHWFTVSKTFEVDGEIIHRLIDVVTHAGIAALIDRCKQAGKALLELMVANHRELHELAIEVRKSNVPRYKIQLGR